MHNKESENIEKIILDSNVVFESKGILEAIQYLLPYEKSARQNELAIESSKIACHILSLSIKSGDFNLFKSTLLSLCKKRGQLKQTICSLVQLTMKQAEVESDLDRKMCLIESLREITEGKIFVEAERAKLALILAELYEKEKTDITSASRVLNELQIETFGSLDLSTRLEFLLEQMRTTLLTGDLTTVQILSKKMLPKVFNDYPSLKARYYDLISYCNLKQGDYLSCSYSLLNILELSSNPENHDLAEKYPSPEFLKKIIICIVLSQHSPEQYDLLLRICKDEKVTSFCPSSFSFVLEAFKKDLLIEWCPLIDLFKSDLEKVVFSSLTSVNFVTQSPESSIISTFINQLKDRVIEHNLRIVSMYYKKVSLNRLSDLILVTGDNTDEKSHLLKVAENHLSSMIAKGLLSGKIDRITGVVTFGENVQSSNALTAANYWVSNMDELLEKVIHVSHLLANEEISVSSTLS